MKVFLLFCILLIATCEAGNRKVNLNKCSNKNPFLKDLVAFDPIGRKNFRTILFDRPQRGTFQVCKTEWNRYGTCCEGKSLLMMFAKELQLTTASVLALEESVDDLRIFGRRAAKFLLIYRVNRHALELARKFQEFAEHPIVANFQQNSRKCWDYMNHLRASAMFPICSGRSEVFFSQGSILISPTTCLSAVESCSSFFTNIRSITSNFSKLTEDYKGHVRKDNYELWSLRALIKELETNKPPQYLVDLFDGQAHSHSQKSLAHKSAEICSMVVNIRKKPYVSKFKLKDFKNKLVMLISKGIRHLINAFMKAGEKLQDFGKNVKAKFQNFGKDVRRHFQVFGQKTKKAFEKMGRDTKRHFQSFGHKTKKSFDKFGRDTKRHFNSFSQKTKQSFGKLGRDVKLHLEKSNKVIKKKFDNFGKKAKKGLQNFGESLAKAFKIKAKPRRKNSRHLNLIEDGGINKSKFKPDAFKSDSLVFIKQGDSMFNSFDGAKGTALFTDSSFHRPMNLTLAFP